MSTFELQHCLEPERDPCRQPWLEAATATSYKKQQTQRASLPIQQSATSGRRHAHDHDHVHEERAQVEQTAVEREGDAANRSAFAKALIQVRDHSH